MKVCKYLTIAFLMLYLLAASIPVEWLWYSPDEVQFADTPQGEAPRLTFTRDIKRDVMIEYSTVTRDAVTGNIQCEGGNGPFEYVPQSGPVVNRDLEWWSGGSWMCRNLPAGVYTTHTTWTLPTPMRSLLPEWARGTVIDRILPPKTITRDTQAFNILSAK